MARKSLFFVIILVACKCLWAQHDTLFLRGKVTDRDTKAGVPYVSIYTSNGLSCTSSAEDGSYEIALPSGF